MSGQLKNGELVALVDAMVDGFATTEQVRRLDDLLRDNFLARRYYVEHMALVVAIERDTLDAPGYIDEVSTGEVPRRDEAPSTTFLPPPFIFRRTFEFLVRPTPFSLGAAALVIGLLITVMALVTPPLYRNVAADGERDAQDVAVTHEVARLTDTHDAVWKDDELGASKGAHLKLGRELALESGLVEITFKTGARSIVEGPAAFQVTSVNSLHLHDGTVVSLVPQRAKGFTVDTDLCRFVDLGTEFGVSVDERNSVEVHVFRGEILLENRGRVHKRQVIRAGTSITVDSTGRTSKLVSGGAVPFVRQIPVVAHIRAEEIKIFTSSPEYHSGYVAHHLIDEDKNTEYASDDVGVGTFVVFDLGRNAELTGFLHVERNDPARVDTSRLEFALEPEFEDVVAHVDVTHDRDSSHTFVKLSHVKARYVRWTVTALGSPYSAVGGAEIRFLEVKNQEMATNQGRSSGNDR